MMKTLKVNGLCAALVLMGLNAATAQDYQVPRTEFGHPDLQGVWTNASQTPLERPREMGEQRAFTPEQAREIEQGWLDYMALRQAPSDPNRPPPTDTNVDLGYDNFWVDMGTDVIRIGDEYRTSILIQPANGRVAYKEGVRPNFFGRRPEGAGPYDGPEARPLGERCLMSFGSSGGPPMLPVMYNNNYQIVQTADYVVILVEMVHDARIIKLNGQHDAHNMQEWMGDSVGYYEGDTLVVKTRNINAQQTFRGSTPEMVVTEYFTRVADDKIEYRFELDDANVFAEPLIGEVAMAMRPDGEPMYEYACHEGNHALAGILAGARVQEQEASPQ
ncbi:hypothetical protein E3V39_02940 [Gammaproteobacteria bacterium LSUCC0112]|nr:hypothetical protein E3V39_02940 [Gammaproteobacteria bacterium LSUCC0112]